MKYVIKESELKSTIKRVVEEEIISAIEEGRIGGALIGALKNTAKTAAKGILAPGLLAQDIVKKSADITTGNDTIVGSVKKFFGDSGAAGGSMNRPMNRRERKAQKQRDNFSAGAGIRSEYGRPETYPGLGNRTKLDKKSEMALPQGSTVNWGDFGKHYHDEGDRMWYRMVLDTERSLTRASHGDPNREIRLQSRYKRKLVDWLKDRDRNYEIYIRSIN